ncbi:ABC transporter ATP-binding protein [bacterium]|nr:MAG: ABC transporter ATP-binding protein [bacterium]
MAKEPVIKLKNVWKTYNPDKVPLHALRGANLEILPNKFVCIIGPSGSGKSTLLHIIGCLDLPSKGNVYLAGQDISQMSENELAQIRGKKIGFIFQQFNIMQNLTALENVMLPMAFLAIPSSKRQWRAEKLLVMMGLKDRITHRPAEMSGGEQQRVAIARALANDPDVILADEPTGNLDSVTGEKVMKIFKTLHEKEKKTIIIITHDHDIAQYGERIIKIKDGQVI